MIVINYKYITYDTIVASRLGIFGEGGCNFTFSNMNPNDVVCHCHEAY